MLNKAEISPEIQNIFLNYYGTQSFNVPYYYADNKYNEGIPQNPLPSLEDFVNSRSSLEKYEDDIEKLLSLSAAFFMYMDVYKKS